MLKRFNFFFNSEGIIHDTSGGNALSSLPELSGVSGGGSKFLAVGDKQGGLSFVNRKLNVAKYVKAHDKSVNVVHQLKSRGIVLTIGDGPCNRGDSTSTLESVIKLWSVVVDQDVSSTQAGFQREEVPHVELLRSFILGSVLAKEKSKPYWAGDGSKEAHFEWPRITCVDLSEDLKHLAIGFSDGHVVLFRSDPFAATSSLSSLVTSELQYMEHKGANLLHEKGQVCTTLQSFKHVGKTSVTGLAFCEKADGAVWLWVATEKNLRSYFCNPVLNAGQSGRLASFTKSSRLGDVEPGPELDTEGCKPHCCCVAKPPSVPLFGSTSTTQSDAVQSEDSHRRKAQFVLAKGDRVEFFSPEDPGSVYAVMGEKRHIAWFRNYLAVVTHGEPGSRLAGGGNVMESADKEDVLQLYDFRSKFIAFSFSLRGEGMGQVKFLTRQWNKLLVFTSTKRLFVLKEKNTRTKLEDLFRRNLYLSAISLASSAGCPESEVLSIYKMYADHLYAKGSFDEAMAQYCRTIGFLEPSYVIRRFLDSQRIENLTTYLEALHSHPTVVPSGDHTTLLLNCYTKQKSESKLKSFVQDESITGAIDVQAAVTVLRSSEYFEQALLLAKERGEHGLYLHILMDDLKRHAEALDFLTHLSPREAKVYLKEYGKVLMERLPDETTLAIERLCCLPEQWPACEGEDVSDLDLPSAEEFIHTFVDHSQCLLRFLKTVVETSEGKYASQLIWNTYLELVLSQTSEKNQPDAEKRAAAEKQAIAILKNPAADYDAHQALVLVQSNDFKKGQLFLFEKLQIYHMLIRHYMEAGDGASVLAKCKTYGGKDPNLWVQVLMYFAQEKEGSNEREILEVLHHIERLRVLPPLVVIDILSKNESIPLSTIRPYITSQLTGAQRIIDEHHSAIQHLRSDTENMKREIQELRTTPKVFTSTKCNLTGAPLELPTVHFLSGNSYNISSLPGGSSAADMAAVATARTGGPAPSSKVLEDPKCAAEQQSVTDIMHKLQQNASTVDEEFFNQLEISPDGFATVAEYFSKCLFEPPPSQSSALSSSNPAPLSMSKQGMDLPFRDTPLSPPDFASAAGVGVKPTRHESTNPFL